ncbi:MAG: TfoX/Sxy family transcriptional regulator of competence genes [Myxococcota bacterium]|jgi:TfoX/Sxy family transcriptional regulator of competence genes
MKMPKPTEADLNLFREVFAEHPATEVKPMFGHFGAFVNGNMCAGLFGADIGLRLSDSEREDLRAIDGAGPFGPPGRPMKQYASVPASWLMVGNPELDAWIHKAITHTAQMPPKVKKPKKAAKK